MRKLFLLIIIIAAGWWWFSNPNQNAHERLQELAQQSHSTYTAIEAQDWPARFSRLWHIHQAVESTIDRKHFVPLDEMPLLLRQAIIATEDKRFYDHGPIDFIGISRAIFVNYQAGKTVEGGSTITQQLVKNLFLTNDRSWLRKGEELLLASQLERVYSKDKILEIYLNTIYYGAGAYGIQEAAQTYFGCDVRDLTLAQCAMLAGLPKSPSALNPLAHYEDAKARQQVVLALMTEQGMISPKMAKAAYEENLHFQKD